MSIPAHTAPQAVYAAASAFDSVWNFANFLEQWVGTIAESSWAYLAMLLFAALDQFVPPIPSDSVLISLTVASRTGGKPLLFLLIPLAVIGAVLGNILCYYIGSKIGTNRFKSFRQGRGLRAITAARVAIEKRGAIYIIASRFIPIARVAVVMTVGAVHYPFKQFMLATVTSALLWATNAVVIGTIAGSIFDERPLLAMAVGMVTGILVGVLIDRVVSRLIR
ncbi:MAG: DedA family protein [Cellulomonadaceae bacterium]|jgi:membrane protein DedA with SNARE-associated domain|nr:DedA family protein [Cellulomonadaceae bacterium]